MGKDEGAARFCMKMDAAILETENGAGQILCHYRFDGTIRMDPALMNHNQSVCAGGGPVEIMQDNSDATAPGGMLACQLQDKRLMGGVLR